MYKSLQSHATRLESDNTELRIKTSHVSDKVVAQAEIIEQLKVFTSCNVFYAKTLPNLISFFSG